MLVAYMYSIRQSCSDITVTLCCATMHNMLLMYVFVHTLVQLMRHLNNNYRIRVNVAAVCSHHHHCNNCNNYNENNS
jgi:hypothetical protein